jgi:hypothetical protein
MKYWPELTQLKMLAQQPVYAQSVARGSGKKIWDWDLLVLDPLKKIGSNLADIIPNSITAAYVLLVGWITAHVVQFIVRKLLGFVRFDTIAEKTGIDSILKEMKVTMSPSIWLSKLTYWIIVLGAAITAVRELRLGIPVFPVHMITGFIFTVFGILIVFLVGIFMSILVARIVEATAQNLKVDKAQTYSRIIKWAVLVLTLLWILPQLAIPMEFIMIPVCAVFITLCLTFIIAFGIGGAAWAGKVLNKLVE